MKKYLVTVEKMTTIEAFVEASTEEQAINMCQEECFEEVIDKITTREVVDLNEYKN